MFTLMAPQLMSFRTADIVIYFPRGSTAPVSAATRRRNINYKAESGALMQFFFFSATRFAFIIVTNIYIKNAINI